jgi:hypothetical protein
VQVRVGLQEIVGGAAALRSAERAGEEREIVLCLVDGVARVEWRGPAEARARGGFCAPRQL